jgi:deoxyribonucleoside regulator
MQAQQRGRGAKLPVSKETDDRPLLISRVASMYYEGGLVQAEIARRVGVSRSTVARYLKEAHELGIVEVRINHPLARSRDLEQGLKERFSLKAACVLAEEGLEYQEMVRRLGVLAAEYLNDQLHAEAVLGLTWGRAVSAVVRAMRRPGNFAVHTVQLSGGLGQMGPERDGLELARSLANLLGGRCIYLRAPLVVKTPELAQALLEDPEISEALKAAKNAEFAIAGIGSLSPEQSTVLEAGYLSAEDLSAFATAGAVGDIGGRYFDAQGKECAVELNARVIGIELQQLKGIPRVVGVAGGPWKSQAILGALKGGLVDVMVTDSPTAKLVLMGDLLMSGHVEGGA